MSKLQLSILLLLAFGLIPATFAQTCEPWIGGPRFCRDLINYTVWETPLWSQEMVFQQIMSPAGILAISVNNDCARAFAALYCQHYYRPCYPTPYPMSVPQPVCRSTCENMKEKCAVSIAHFSAFTDNTSRAIVAALTTPCNRSDIIFRTTPAFPEEFAYYDLRRYGYNATVEVPCNAQIYSERDTMCQYPLAYEPTTNLCGLLCPIPFYDWDQYYIMYIFSIVWGYIGFFGSLFVVITYALIPEKRHHVAIYYAAASAVFCFALMMESWWSPREVWCNERTVTASQSDAKCGVMGSLFYWGMLAVHTWFLVIAFNMFHSLVLKRRRTKLLTILYHVWGWGPPTVYLIVALSMDGIGYLNTTPVCTLINESGSTFDVLMYCLPLLFVAALGTPLLISTVFVVFRKFRNDKKNDAIVANARVLLFLLCFLYYSLALSVTRILFIRRRDPFLSSFVSWYYCNQVAREECTFENDDWPWAIPMVIWTANSGIIALSPIVFFGIKADVGRWWKQATISLSNGTFSFSTSTKSSSVSSLAVSRRSAELTPTTH